MALHNGYNISRSWISGIWNCTVYGRPYCRPGHLRSWGHRDVQGNLLNGLWKRTLSSILTAENERATYFVLSGPVWIWQTAIPSWRRSLIGRHNVNWYDLGAHCWRRLYLQFVCSTLGFLYQSLRRCSLFANLPVHDPFHATSARCVNISRYTEIDSVGTILLIGVFLSGLMAISCGGLVTRAYVVVEAWI